MLDTTLNAAMTAPSLRAFTAVQIVLSGGYTINLLDGTGTVTFSGTTFIPQDGTYGSLAAVTAAAEQVANSAPTLSLTLYPPTAAAIGTLCSPLQQGSSVRVWFGLVNEATGAAIGTPELVWSGRWDAANATLGEGLQLVEIETVSAFDRLFAVEEGQRLNKTWHQSIWPGETGLDFTTEAQRETYWGTEGPGSSAIVGTGGGMNRDPGGQVRER